MIERADVFFVDRIVVVFFMCSPGSPFTDNWRLISFTEGCAAFGVFARLQRMRQQFFLVFLILSEISAKVSFQEFRHSGGMPESSPAIHRRVCRRENARPGGTLDQPRTNEFHP